LRGGIPSKCERIASLVCENFNFFDLTAKGVKSGGLPELEMLAIAGSFAIAPVDFDGLHGNIINLRSDIDDRWVFDTHHPNSRD